MALAATFLPFFFPELPNKASLSHLLKFEVRIVVVQRLGISLWGERKKKVWCLYVCPADLIPLCYYECMTSSVSFPPPPFFFFCSLSSIFLVFLFFLSPASFFTCSLLCNYVEAARVRLWTFAPHRKKKNITPFPLLATAAVFHWLSVSEYTQLTQESPHFFWYV